MAVFFLQATNGSGNDLGRISIFLNAGTNDVPEGRGWEWQGSGINTGGSFQWSHNGNGYVMELNHAGSSFAFLLGWFMTPNPNNEPPRPWFARTGVNGGIGGVAQGSPARLGPGFNWSLM